MNVEESNPGQPVNAAMSRTDRKLLERLEAEWAQQKISLAEYQATKQEILDDPTPDPPMKAQASVWIRSIVVVLLSAGLVIGGLWVFLTWETPLEKAEKACGSYSGRLTADNGKSLIIKAVSESEFSHVGCLMYELDVPSHVIEHISTTRALDGQQTAEWKRFSARWTYHPSSGLSLTIVHK